MSPGGPTASGPVGTTPPRPWGPTTAQRERWRAADDAARPYRLEHLRARLADEDLDAWFGLRPENGRYLSGFVLGDGEEKVCGASGRLFVSADETVVVADSRYRLQALEECTASRIAELADGFAEAWPELVASLRPIGGTVGGSVRRIGVEAGFLSHAEWLRLARATPDIELVPLEGYVEAQRQVKEPAEIERISVACAIADAALEATLSDIEVGRSERELAMALEWRMRSSGADGLAFDVACLGGPRAALPHGSPAQRRLRGGEVLLLDFGARVEGYRSDMTRTLFVGDAAAADLEIYGHVAEAQSAALELLRHALANDRPITNREVDTAARDIIASAGHAAHFGHGTGHGIGLATHELPSLGRSAQEAALPSPTVFSVEPGIYIDGRSGVRIEDLVSFDRGSGRLDVLTGFPRAITVVGA